MELVALNKFRIGNYYHRVERKGFTCEKISLDLLSRIFSDDIRVAFNDFVGIDLTENWIMDLGFKKTLLNTDTAEVARFSDCGLYSIIKLKSKSGSWLFRVGNIEIRDIEYVHDFQNIYFGLTNKELKLPCTANGD